MDNFPLSPEEQVFSTGEGQPWKFGKGEFDLIGALEAGYTKPEIAQHLSQKKNFNYVGASKAGYSDGEIISHLLGAGAFDAFSSQFMYNMQESALGLTQAGSKITGGEFNKKRAQAFSDAADILSEGESFAKWSGIISGSMADPISIPAGFLKFIKAGTLAKELAAKGTAQGIFGGVVAPTYKEEWSDILAEKAEKTIVGGIFGGGIGAGIGKGLDFLAKRAEGKLKTPEADIPAGKAEQAAADDALSSLIKYDQDIQAKKLSETLSETNYNIPAWQRRTEGQGVEASRINEPTSPETIKLLEDRLTEAQAKVAKTEESLFEINKQQPEKQVAALLRKPEGETPAKMGLVEPAKETPEKQIAALFKATPVENNVIREEVKQTAFLLDRKKGLENELKLQQAEVAKAQQFLDAAKAKQVNYPQAAQRVEAPTPEQVAARDAAVEQRMQQGKGPVPAEAPRAPEPVQAPVAVTREQLTQTLTRLMDESGAKNWEDHIIKTGKPDEVAAARARIKAGTPLSLDKVVDDAMRMQGARGSVGAMAARPETVFGDVVVFPTAEKAAMQVAQGKTAPTLNREDLGVPELEKMVQQTVGFLGKPLKQMREGGDFAGTLKGSREAGEKLIAKAQKEEGSLLGYFFKEDAEGNFVNLDKTWNRADVAAFAPVVKYAERVYNALMDEAVVLRKAGKLEGDALNDVAYRLQFPVQIMGILQGKRTEASRTLNAYKLLRENWDSGKEVKGFFSPGSPCM